MPRDASTYRGARRNACIRELHAIWGPDWYYKGHNLAAHKTDDGGPHRRKTPTHKTGIHQMIRRGDYAAAVRAFFSPRTRASGRGD